MPAFRCLFAALTLGLMSCEARPPAIPIEPGVSEELAQYRASVITDLSYQLALSVPRSQVDAIQGHMRITFDLADASRPLQIDYREDAGTIKSTKINGRDATIEARKEHLLVPEGLLEPGPLSGPSKTLRLSSVS